MPNIYKKFIGGGGFLGILLFAALISAAQTVNCDKYFKGYFKTNQSSLVEITKSQYIEYIPMFALTFKGNIVNVDDCNYKFDFVSPVEMQGISSALEITSATEDSITGIISTPLQGRVVNVNLYRISKNKFKELRKTGMADEMKNLFSFQEIKTDSLTIAKDDVREEIAVRESEEILKKIIEKRFDDIYSKNGYDSLLMSAYPKSSFNNFFQLVSSNIPSLDSLLLSRVADYDKIKTTPPAKEVMYYINLNLSAINTESNPKPPKEIRFDFIFDSLENATLINSKISLYDSLQISPSHKEMLHSVIADINGAMYDSLYEKFSPLYKEQATKERFLEYGKVIEPYGKLTLYNYIIHSIELSPFYGHSQLHLWYRCTFSNTEIGDRYLELTIGLYENESYLEGFNFSFDVEE